MPLLTVSWTPEEGNLRCAFLEDSLWWCSASMTARPFFLPESESNLSPPAQRDEPLESALGCIRTCFCLCRHFLLCDASAVHLCLSYAASWSLPVCRVSGGLVSHYVQGRSKLGAVPDCRLFQYLSVAQDESFLYKWCEFSRSKRNSPVLARCTTIPGVSWDFVTTMRHCKVQLYKENIQR